MESVTEVNASIRSLSPGSVPASISGCEDPSSELLGYFRSSAARTESVSTFFETANSWLKSTFDFFQLLRELARVAPWRAACFAVTLREHKIDLH